MKAEWERFPFKEFLGREFTHLALKGLETNEGNGWVDVAMQNETGQGTVGSRPRRMAKLTLFIPKCRRVGVRGALGDFKVRSLDAPLSVQGQGNRDYGSTYEITDLGGSLEADNVPIHRIDGVRGDVSVIVTAYPGDKSSSMNGPSLTTRAYPPGASEYRKVLGALRVRACRVDLTLGEIGGRVDVANDFGRTVWTLDRPPARIDHRVVSESGTIEVRIGKDMPGDLPMMLFSECGAVNLVEAGDKVPSLKFSSTNGNDVFESLMFHSGFDDTAVRSWHGFYSKKPGPRDPLDSFERMRRVAAALNGRPRPPGIDLLSRAGAVTLAPIADGPAK